MHMNEVQWLSIRTMSGKFNFVVDFQEGRNDHLFREFQRLHDLLDERKTRSLTMLANRERLDDLPFVLFPNVRVVCEVKEIGARVVVGVGALAVFNAGIVGRGQVPAVRVVSIRGRIRGAPRRGRGVDDCVGEDARGLDGRASGSAWLDYRGFGGG